MTTVAGLEILLMGHGFFVKNISNVLIKNKIEKLMIKKIKLK